MLGLCTDGDVGTETSDGEGTDIVGGPASDKEPVSETEMDGVGAGGGSDGVREAEKADEGDIEDDDDEGEDIEEICVLSEIGIEALSGIGLSRRMSGEVTADALGRRKEVSKDISAPSGKAMDCTDGDAARIEDSYESSVSVAQIEPWKEGERGA